MKPRILVIGSSNTDMVIRLPRLPRPGETLLGGEFRAVAGGKGANQAIAAARAGGDVTFVARVGTDSFGDSAIAGFERDGVETSHVLRTAGAPSGVALIMVSEGGENSIAVASGANAFVSAEDLYERRELFEAADVVLVQLETPLEGVAAAIQLANEFGKKVILNPAPALGIAVELLRQVTILTPNETEAEILSGVPVVDMESAERAGERLISEGCPTVIITCGARGALLMTSDRRELVPSREVRPIDTTAAGDVFNGALAVALGEGRDLSEGVRFANVAASISVTRPGAQPSAPYREEIDRLL